MYRVFPYICIPNSIDNMKQIAFLIFASVLISACNQSDQANAGNPAVQESTHDHPETKDLTVTDTANLTSIEWLDSNYVHMGKIVDGQNLEVVFRFRNSGNKPLLISQVSAGCGCTVPETPKEPFAPGQEGQIKAVFNSTGRVGNNRKEVFVFANTNPASNMLIFEVDVLKNLLKTQSN